jgi:hypothetical protein
MSLTQRFQFRHPTTGVIVGRSQAGKSSLVLNIIKNKDYLFDKKIHVIIYIYQHWQKEFDDFKDGVIFVKDIPHDWDQSKNTLLICDDFQLNKEMMKEICDIFLRRASHGNASCFYIAHSLVFNDQYFRLICTNAQFYILFKAIRNSHQITLLGKQIFGNKKKAKAFFEAYFLAVGQPFGYLIIDQQARSPLVDDMTFLRSGILPNDNQYVYRLRD